MMRAAWALGAVLLAGVLPGSAQAAPEVVGGLCQWIAVDSPYYGEREMTVYAAFAVTDEGAPVRASIRCVVREGPTHTAPELGSAQSATMTGVVVLPPTVISYLIDPEVWADVCSELHVEGAAAPLYWDDEARAWSADPEVPCVDWAPPPPGDPIMAEVDRLICPVLAQAFPPDGDVVVTEPVGLFWDCPPYGDV